MIENDFTFIATGANECPLCGLIAFSHHHKAGSLPKDFEMIQEPQEGGERLTDDEARIVDLIKDIITEHMQGHKLVGSQGEQICQEILDEIDDTFSRGETG